MSSQKNSAPSEKWTIKKIFSQAIGSSFGIIIEAALTSALIALCFIITVVLWRIYS